MALDIILFFIYYYPRSIEEGGWINMCAIIRQMETGDVLFIETDNVMLGMTIIDQDRGAVIVQAVGPAAGSFKHPSMVWINDRDIACHQRLVLLKQDSDYQTRQWVDAGEIMRVIVEHNPQKAVKLLTNYILWKEPRKPMRLEAARESFFYEHTMTTETKEVSARKRSLLDFFR